MRSGGHARSGGLTELRRPCTLDPRVHDRTRFDCGDQGLNEWLRRYAGQNRRANTAAVWVVVDAEDAVVAYATLSMTGIDVSSAPRSLAKGAPDPVPALLLGRLAVDRGHTGMGVGSALVAHVLATAIELNTHAACKAVVVTALDQRAREWWERLGFQPFDPDRPDSRDLYLLTSDVEATLRHLG
jgi:GNAT superfamily N-acetyltransferase